MLGAFFMSIMVTRLGVIPPFFGSHFSICRHMPNSRHLEIIKFIKQDNEVIDGIEMVREDNEIYQNIKEYNEDINQKINEFFELKDRWGVAY